jgi:hypothetical protein
MRSVLWAPAAAEGQTSMKIDLQQALGSALAETDRLRRERERLVDENEDLRASAEFWLWLYQHQLARANKAVRELAVRSIV